MYRVTQHRPHALVACGVEIPSVTDFDTNLIRSTTPSVEFDDDETDTAAPISDSPSKGREGLPSGFRMRADAHYVDELTSTSARLPGPAAPNADAEVQRAEQMDRMQRLLERLSADLATIQSVAGLIGDAASPLARRLHLDLIQAEAWRSAWLIEAHRLLNGDRRSDVRPRPIGPMLERLRQGFSAESRLRGTSLQVRTSDWNATVAVDETVILTAIAGALLATVGLVGDRDCHAPLRVTVEALAGQLRTVEVAQDEVEAPAIAGVRFFDLGWTDRPGGWLAAVGAATAKAVARQHGGHAALLVGEPRGTVVRLNLTPAH
ncbi:MAG: hypothetical protein ABI051_12575 [Vicinamibacterales bacterium]